MKKVYKNVNILDGTKDMKLQENMMITVQDGVIVSIENNNDETEGIDLKGKYLIPEYVLKTLFKGKYKSTNLHLYTHPSPRRLL